MRKHCQWLGTDALTLVENPPTDTVLWWIKLIAYRWKWKIYHRIFDKHYIVHERLRKHLIDFGIKNEKISVVIDPPKYTKKYKKIPHEGFNILYYHPPKACLGGETYIRWKYGIDLIEDIKRYLLNYKVVNFIKIDGSQDLSKIYPITDFMLRPSRHDGLPRINLECEINDIPYYYTNNGINITVLMQSQIIIEISKWKSQGSAEKK